MGVTIGEKILNHRNYIRLFQKIRSEFTRDKHYINITYIT